jgi:hypothetical protein
MDGDTHFHKQHYEVEMATQARVRKASAKMLYLVEQYNLNYARDGHAERQSRSVDGLQS